MAIILLGCVFVLGAIQYSLEICIMNNCDYIDLMPNLKIRRFSDSGRNPNQNLQHSMMRNRMLYTNLLIITVKQIPNPKSANL